MGASKANQIIETDDGRYILRNVGSVHHYAQFQLQIMRHLAHSDFGYETPQLKQTITGSDHIFHQEEMWILYRFVEGRPLPAGSTPALAGERGRMAAHFHRVMRQMSVSHPEAYALPLFTTERANEILQAGKTTVSHLAARTPFETLLFASTDRILAAYNKIAAEQKAAIGKLDVFPIYNDWHGNNILTRNGKLTGLIDFDSVTIAPRINDFQNAALYAVGTNSGLDSGNLAHFTRGYMSVCPLSEVELLSVYPLMMDGAVNTLATILHERMSTHNTIKDDICHFLLVTLNWLTSHEQEFTAQLLAGAAS
jgi:Ser/Thr protein kinase RdoA (MazF antagonist)